MTTLRNTLIIELDDLEHTEIAELRRVITETLSSFHAVDADPTAVYGWTPTLARELYDRLIACNRPAQAKTIAAEARNGGEVDRSEVYAIGSYPADRSLSGFTKPVGRIMRDMQDEGLLPLDAVNPLQPIYDPANPSYQKAKGFRMPPELAPVFAALPE